MNKWHFYGLALIGIFLFSSCGKNLPNEWQRLEGTWTNEEVFMEISKDGNFLYKRKSQNESVSIDAWIADYSEKGFVVTILVSKIDFIVNRKPFYNEEIRKMQMVVDGRLLTKREDW